MELLTRSILVAVYPLLLLGHLLNRLLGCDPLRLREPRGATYWIERKNSNDQADYFSEAATQGGRGHAGFGWLAATVLRGAARLFAPPPADSGSVTMAAAERDQDIPDEVYTLW
jgi:hypothetical protein